MTLVDLQILVRGVKAQVMEQEDLQIEFPFHKYFAIFNCC